MLCVNKMDLVDYSQEVYDRIHDEFRAFATRLQRARPHASSRSPRCRATTWSPAREHMPWYDGSSLLHHLENVHVASDRNLIDVRFPVQYVIRPQSDGAGTTTAATPARWPAACSRPVTT